MSDYRHFQGAFSGGEVTPEYYGRAGDGKFQMCAAKVRNFLALPHGPAKNRPGFMFVAETKKPGARLLSFIYSSTQTMIIEMGQGYFRFHVEGATLVTSTGAPYEITNQYSQEALPAIRYVQSNDVMTLVHPEYPPMELRRYGALDWRFVRINFAPTISAPYTPSITKANQEDTNEVAYTYVVTAVNAAGDESVASGQQTMTGNLAKVGAYNTLTWGGVSGAVKYKVYKKSCGVFGFIGATRETTFRDELIAPNTAKVPPEYNSVFSSNNNYPRTVTYFEQRRCFAGTKNSPQTLWMTKTGTESNMSMPVVTADADAIEVRVATRSANTILHLVPLSSLVLLTSTSELLCTATNVTQNNISIKPQSYVGASDVQPVIVNNIMLYVSSRGNHIREMGYNWQANGMVTGDLSLRAPHLFDGKKIIDLAFSASPYPIAWAVSASGELLGLTYIPEESIGGWHVHETDGKFKSCAVVAENGDDRLYVIVERTVNGLKRQYIECMANMFFDKQEDAFFVDSGLTYSGIPSNRIRGLEHLEGKTVSILGDGSVFPKQVVKNGVVELDEPCSKIHIGLPYSSVLETLPVLTEMDSGYGTGRPKNVNRCFVRMYRSSGVFVGPDSEHLREYKQRRDETPGAPPVLKTEEIEVVSDGMWANGGQVYIVQNDPLPLTVVSVSLDMSVGG